MKQVVLLCMFSLLLFTGCRYYGAGIRVEGSYPYTRNMPPLHAPAHGRRQHHLYHYYPNAEFYFDVGRNMYFYLDSRRQWTFSVNLPFHLRSYLHNGYVEIEMENDRPYLRHNDHKNKYNKPAYRNKWKYKNDRKYKSNRKYKSDLKYKTDRKYKNEYKYKDESKYKNKQKYKDNKKKARNNNDKYRDDEDDDRRKNGRRYERD